MRKLGQYVFFIQKGACMEPAFRKHRRLKETLVHNLDIPGRIRLLLIIFKSFCICLVNSAKSPELPLYLVKIAMMINVLAGKARFGYLIKCHYLVYTLYGEWKTNYP